MFESVVFLLLSGQFICRVSHNEAHDYLSDEARRHEVEVYLSRIGRRLARTTHGSGYYLAFARCGEDERKAIRTHFAEVKGTLAPVVMFFHLLMRTTGKDDLLMQGTIIQTPTLLAQIDQDPTLRNELQSVATMLKAIANDGSHRTMFDKVIRRLTADGYLVLVNSEQGYLQVTAKIEYLLEVVRFLRDNDEALRTIVDDDDSTAAGVTGTLL